MHGYCVFSRRSITYLPEIVRTGYGKGNCPHSAGHDFLSSIKGTNRLVAI